MNFKENKISSKIYDNSNKNMYNNINNKEVDNNTINLPNTITDREIISTNEPSNNNYNFVKAKDKKKRALNTNMEINKGINNTKTRREGETNNRNNFDYYNMNIPTNIIPFNDKVVSNIENKEFDQSDLKNSKLGISDIEEKDNSYKDLFNIKNVNYNNNYNTNEVDYFQSSHKSNENKRKNESVNLEELMAKQENFEESFLNILFKLKYENNNKELRSNNIRSNDISPYKYESNETNNVNRKKNTNREAKNNKLMEYFLNKKNIISNNNNYNTLDRDNNYENFSYSGLEDSKNYIKEFIDTFNQKELNSKNKTKINNISSKERIKEISHKTYNRFNNYDFNDFDVDSRKKHLKYGNNIITTKIITQDQRKEILGLETSVKKKLNSMNNINSLINRNNNNNSKKKGFGYNNINVEIRKDSKSRSNKHYYEIDFGEEMNNNSNANTKNNNNGISNIKSIANINYINRKLLSNNNRNNLINRLYDKKQIEKKASRNKNKTLNNKVKEEKSLEKLREEGFNLFNKKNKTNSNVIPQPRALIKKSNKKISKNKDNSLNNDSHSLLSSSTVNINVPNQNQSVTVEINLFGNTLTNSNINNAINNKHNVKKKSKSSPKNNLYTKNEITKKKNKFKYNNNFKNEEILTDLSFNLKGLNNDINNNGMTINNNKFTNDNNIKEELSILSNKHTQISRIDDNYFELSLHKNNSLVMFKRNKDKELKKIDNKKILEVFQTPVLSKFTNSLVKLEDNKDNEEIIKKELNKEEEIINNTDNNKDIKENKDIDNEDYFNIFVVERLSKSFYCSSINSWVNIINDINQENLSKTKRKIQFKNFNIDNYKEMKIRASVEIRDINSKDTNYNSESNTNGKTIRNSLLFNISRKRYSSNPKSITKFNEDGNNLSNNDKKKRKVSRIKNNNNNNNNNYKERIIEALIRKKEIEKNKKKDFNKKINTNIYKLDVYSLLNKVNNKNNSNKNINPELLENYINKQNSDSIKVRHKALLNRSCIQLKSKMSIKESSSNLISKKLYKSINLDDINIKTRELLIFKRYKNKTSTGANTIGNHIKKDLRENKDKYKLLNKRIYSNRENSNSQVHKNSSFSKTSINFSHSNNINKAKTRAQSSSKLEINISKTYTNNDIGKKQAFTSIHNKTNFTNSNTNTNDNSSNIPNYLKNTISKAKKIVSSRLSNNNNNSTLDIIIKSFNGTKDEFKTLNTNTEKRLIQRKNKISKSKGKEAYSLFGYNNKKEKINKSSSLDRINKSLLFNYHSNTVINNSTFNSNKAKKAVNRIKSTEIKFTKTSNNILMNHEDSSVSYYKNLSLVKSKYNTYLNKRNSDGMIDVNKNYNKRKNENYSSTNINRFNNFNRTSANYKKNTKSEDKNCFMRYYNTSNKQSYAYNSYNAYNNSNSYYNKRFNSKINVIINKFSKINNSLNSNSNLSVKKRRIKSDEKLYSKKIITNNNSVRSESKLVKRQYLSSIINNNNSHININNATKLNIQSILNNSYRQILNDSLRIQNNFFDKYSELTKNNIKQYSFKKQLTPTVVLNSNSRKSNFNNYRNNSSNIKSLEKSTRNNLKKISNMSKNVNISKIDPSYLGNDIRNTEISSNTNTYKTNRNKNIKRDSISNINSDNINKYVCLMKSNNYISSERQKLAKSVDQSHHIHKLDILNHKNTNYIKELKDINTTTTNNENNKLKKPERTNSYSNLKHEILKYYSIFNNNFNVSFKNSINLNNSSNNNSNTYGKLIRNNSFIIRKNIGCYYSLNLNN